MDEIEKMYENARIKKITLFKPKHSIILGDYDKKYVDYPPFTAEKQLKLLQLLTQQCDLIISHFTEWEFIYFDGQESTQSNR